MKSHIFAIIYSILLLLISTAATDFLFVYNLDLSNKTKLTLIDLVLPTAMILPW